MSFGTMISLKGLGGFIMAGLSSISPAGWVAIGAIIVIGIIAVESDVFEQEAVSIEYYSSKSKEKSKEEVDSYARPGQKKQGREKKNKNRRKDNFEDRSNKRTKKPPKDHTPGKDHQKYKKTR